MVKIPAGDTSHSGDVSGLEPNIESFAEELSRLLGTAEAKTTAWLDQRKILLKQLIAVRDKAEALISTLTSQDSPRGHADDQPAARRSVKSSARGQKAPASAISAEGRARISAAQKRRWARYRAVSNK